VLLRSGLKPTDEDKSLGFAGYELLTVLAQRQFMLRQSVILDSVAASQTIRSTITYITQTRSVWEQAQDLPRVE
jgi:hypothetical protein